jgi:putative drug exporter of the RND superfamily
MRGTVLIVDDHPSFRASARAVLEADGIEADIDAKATQQAIADLKKQAVATGQIHGPIEVDINPSHTVARVAIPLNGEGTDAESNQALQTLRNDVLPATIGKVDGANWAVTGGTAGSYDENLLLRARRRSSSGSYSCSRS